MAALATRFVRLRIEPGFAAHFRDVGNDAGTEFARAFRLRVTASLAGFNPRVRVQLDVDSFNRPNLPPLNLRVGFDMTSAIQAGRRAAMVASAAAGPINLQANFAGFGGVNLGTIINAIGGSVTILNGTFNTFNSVARQATSAAQGFMSQLTALAGPIGMALKLGLFVEFLTMLPALASLAIGAVFALGGALASIPAVTVGLGFSVGALGLGFMGLADHLKDTGKSGGGASKSMSAVNSATRSLTRANRELLKATKEIDNARAGEIERIDDLGRALRGAVIDEADAVAAVAEARTALAEARGTGDPNAIGAAERALNRANLTLDESRDKVGDLAADKAKADRDGVEGSDAMQQAYERQRDAVEAVKAAEEALADARKSGGGGGAAKELMKLAPAAQEVVDKLKQLKPAFEGIRLAVQQALFVGVAGELQRLADAWKQPLKDTLTSYASTFNGLFMNLGRSVRNPEFIKNITAGADTVRKNIDKIGTAITGPLVDAFGRLTRAAKPFIDMLGDKITGLVESFSAWIKSADESGKLDKFMQDAAFYLGEIWRLGGNVVGIFGDILAIFADSKSQGGAKDTFQNINEQLERLRGWLQDPENQKKAREFLDRIGDIVAKLHELTIWIMDDAIPALQKLWSKFEEGKSKFDQIKQRIEEVRETWRKFRDIIGLPIPFGGMFDGLAGSFRSAMNRVIDAWNRLQFTIPGFSFFGVSSPPIPVRTVDIPRLASGGVVQPRPGGALVNVAEAGEAEIVAPESKMQQLLNKAMQAAGTGQAPVVVAHIYLDGRELKQTVVETIVANPEPVARANRAGSKRLGYAG